jgi:hypothetical protein
MAITSLLLPFTSQVHWMTGALWVASMLSAFLSVMFVCQKQRFIGRLLIHEKRNEKRPCEKEKFRSKMREGDSKLNIPRLSVVLLLCASKTFLNYAIVAYVLGLGVYLGFVWQNSLDADAGRDDSRNIFIVFLIFTCFCLCIIHLVPNPNLEEWRDFCEEWNGFQNAPETVHQLDCECVGVTKGVAQVSEEGYCGAG